MEFTEQDRIRVSRVLGRMPYLPGVRVSTLNVKTLDQLLGVLEAFEAYLREHAEDDTERDIQLGEFNAMARAAGKFFTLAMSAAADYRPPGGQR